MLSVDDRTTKHGTYKYKYIKTCVQICIKAIGGIKKLQTYAHAHQHRKGPNKTRWDILGFLCIFDHWAHFAQTEFSLRAAAEVLNMERRTGSKDTMT